MNKIRRNDTVKILRGEDNGKTGVVRTVLPREGKVIVEGIRLVKKAQKRTQNVRTQSGIIQREAPIPIANVMLVCKNCGKPTRVSVVKSEDGSRARVCHHCDQAQE